MTERPPPKLQAHFSDKCPEEAAIVGRLLLSFGELEYRYCLMAGSSLNHWQELLRSLYRLRSTSSRIDAAESMMRGAYARVGIQSEFEQATLALRNCLAIRNRYAHCHWAYDAKDGLFFGDLEKAASKKDHDYLVYDWMHIDRGILLKQEEYFGFTINFLSWTQESFLALSKKLPSQGFPKPTTLPLPTPHNARSEHVPPWLTEHLREQHRTHAAESEQRGRSHSKTREGKNGESSAQHRKKKSSRQLD